MRQEALSIPGVLSAIGKILQLRLQQSSLQTHICIFKTQIHFNNYIHEIWIHLSCISRKLLLKLFCVVEFDVEIALCVVGGCMIGSGSSL